jgi:hypothetical protein
LWAASVHLVNACKKNTWETKKTLSRQIPWGEWSHSQGCRHTKEKNYTGKKTLGMVSLILETLQCYYCQPKVDWTSVIINRKKHAIRTKQKHTCNHQQNTCTQDNARPYMQPPTKCMQSGLSKNIHATINKTHALRTMQEHICNHQQNACNQD